MSETGILQQTDDLLRAIGDAVVCFQQIEQWVAEELAVLLRMRDREDQYLVSAAMSFKQKVDLLVAIFPKRAERHPKLPLVDITVARKALYAAEEYRNRVVHSFYALDCESSSRWLRLKGYLKGRAGFSLNTVEANVVAFQECNEALKVIRGWSLCKAERLTDATAVLSKHMQDGTV